MGDFYEQGRRLGYHGELNSWDDFPQDESDKESFRRGVEKGVRERQISNDIDRDLEQYR